MIDCLDGYTFCTCTNKVSDSGILPPNTSPQRLDIHSPPIEPHFRHFKSGDLDLRFRARAESSRQDLDHRALLHTVVLAEQPGQSARS